jgi:hypothetical protein
MDDRKGNLKTCGALVFLGRRSKGLSNVFETFPNIN